MTELHELTLAEQATAIRERTVSPVDLVDHHLRRIDRLNDAVGAYRTVDHRGARQAAAAAEARLAAAEDTSQLPPLLGVPISVKDTWPVAGLPFTAGSAVFADRIAPGDAAVVGALRAAGTVLLGTTLAAEFGCSSYTETAHGTARSPYDLNRGAGGSSGGAAASVAARLAAGALGSDGGGSIRIPAAACGLVGLKPSRGRVTPAPGTDALGLATAGPLARTVFDTALLLDVMAHSTPGDSGTLPAGPPGTFRASAERAPGRLRIGVLPETAGQDRPSRLGCRRTADLLAELGHQVDEAPPFGPAEYLAAFTVVWSVLAASVPVPPGREGDLLALTAWLRSEGRARSAPDLLAAHASLTATARELLSRYAEFDVILSPTTDTLAPPVGSLVDQDAPERTFARMLDFTPRTPLANLTGQPSISLPLHWTPDGLPVGIMLTGRPHQEATLLALGAQLEQARPWLHHTPQPVLDRDSALQAAAHRDTGRQDAGHRDTAHRGLAFQAEGGTT
ncbi:amidase [Kitasatospora sp. NBC_01300]|uniref:amidase n=1 Tax=Kitasatospora sp. NBC_01300 TaxID=2903574 RepID=UPI00352E6673|nr:amidase [Kitasatospora sp. NBC_01300]